MNKELIVLSLDRIVELGQKAYGLHQELEKWREPKFTDLERTKIGCKIQNLFDEQFKWIRAIQEKFQDEE